MQHVEVAQRSALEMTDYLRGLIKQCRDNPRDDLISALVMAEEQGNKFSEEELYSMFVILQIGGHETTTNLIANGMLALLQHPDQLEMLCADPALIEDAVEEMLRFYCPIQTTGRIAIDDMELAGQSIRKGQLVQFVLGAANRDPAKFADPDRFDITRKDNRHLAFAIGPHFCIGAALARLEARIAIGSMLKKLTNLRLHPPLTSDSPLEEFDWNMDNPVFYGLKTLPVTFDASRS